MKTLLLEDDYLLNMTITDELKKLGLFVDSFCDGEEALDAIYKRVYDLYILDINVPNINGYEMLNYIREINQNSPILMISILSKIENLKLAYSGGCDDYIKKPFDLEELMLKVKHNLKILRKRNDSLISLGDGFNYCFEKNRLLHNKKIVKLTKNDNLILRVMIKNMDLIVTYEMLKDEVWNGKEIGDSTIRFAMHQLVKKLNPNMIENIKGVGYRLKIE